MLMVLLIVIVTVGGYYMLEAIKIRHGYPLTDENGNRIDPAEGSRSRALEQENEALREQLDAVHERLETLERIVTDKPSKLEAEIDALKTLSDRREKQE